MNLPGIFKSYLLLLVFLISACSSVAVQNTVEPTSVRTPDTSATVAFERTAIARFTENPESAEMMTPYYGEILWNEVIRQITETPIFDPDRECYPVGDFWQLRELSDSIEIGLAEVDIPVISEAWVNVVWNTNVCDEFLIVENTIRIWVQELIEPESDEFDVQLISILEVFLSETENATDISPVPVTIELGIYFDAANSRFFIETNRLVVSRALENGLSGEPLIESLGGLTIINNP